jgi:hypothetical protein
VLWGNDNSALDRTAAVLIVVLTVTLVFGFVGLSLAGIDTTSYVLFCAGPIVSTAVGAILSRKVNAVAATVAVVEKQTNGIATAHRAQLDAHLTAQDVAAVEVATAAEKRAERQPQGPASGSENERPAGA